jgi:hypothetical protein
MGPAGHHRHADGRERDQHQFRAEPDLLHAGHRESCNLTASIGSIFSVTSAAPISGLYAPGGTINSTGTTINVTSGNGAAGADVGFNGLINMTGNTISTTGPKTLLASASTTARWSASIPV